MDPATLIPASGPVPFYGIFFHICILIAFYLHILLVNLVIGGSILVFMDRFFKSQVMETRKILPKLPVILAFAVNLGVASLLFLQTLYSQFIYVSSQLIAVYWISVVFVLIIGYYLLYYQVYQESRDSREKQKWISFAVLLCFLYIPFVFVNNMTLMLSPEAWTAYAENPGGTILNLDDPVLAPRLLHFLLASLAVGGLFHAALQKHARKTRPQEGYMGMKVFTGATALQIIAGFWFLLSLPEGVLPFFFGENLLYTGLLLAGILLGFILVVLGILQKVYPAISLTLVLIFLMVVMRDLVRDAYLLPFFQMENLEMVPQFGAFAMFLACLGIGAGLTGYLVYVYVKARKTGGAAAGYPV